MSPEVNSSTSQSEDPSLQLVSPCTGILSLRGSGSEVFAVTNELLVAVSGVCPRAEDE